MDAPNSENLAATLARVLPQAHLLHQTTLAQGTGKASDMHFAVPKGFDVKSINTEALLPNPLRAKGTATMGDSASFIAYVNEFARNGSAVWCEFNPQTASLYFHAVIDEHAPDLAGWRSHQVTYTPAMSIEWLNWNGSNGSGKTFGQVEFAEFIEKNENDIAQADGYPTSLDMHKMATEFVARSEMAIKSTVRMQDGGVRLNYIADADAGTLEQMRLFEKFCIGIPVFWTATVGDEPVPAYRIFARLKYRVRDGKVTFWYELIRPDRLHQLAAMELIEQIRSGIGSVPLRMGAFA